MSKHPKWTIAVSLDSNSVARKITKIIGLESGFSVATPYHKACQGYLCKMPVDPAIKGTHTVPWDECIGYTVESRAKLSYHSDGFVQFSSEKEGDIISGRDSMTGEPKGCALMTHPLASPILSGPSASVTFWGLHDFEPLDSSDEDAIVFDSQLFFYLDCPWGNAKCWTLEIWVFPAALVAPFCQWRGEHLIFKNTAQLESGLVVPKSFTVLFLPDQNIYLGLAIDGMEGHFPSASGWILGGPGDWTNDKKGYVLAGAYPRECIPIDGSSALDYKS